MRRRESDQGDLSALKIWSLTRDEFLERQSKHLGQREQRPQGRVRRTSRPRLALLVLLIRVARQTSAVSHLLLAKAGVFSSAAKRRRQALSVHSPLFVSSVVMVGHLFSVASPTCRYGLIRMA